MAVILARRYHIAIQGNSSIDERIDRFGPRIPAPKAAGNCPDAGQYSPENYKSLTDYQIATSPRKPQSVAQ